MLTWIDQSIVKIVELEYELKNLRQGHIIADKRHKGSLASLKSLAAKGGGGSGAVGAGWIPFSRCGQTRDTCRTESDK